MKKCSLVIFIVMCFGISGLKAQSYTTAVGAKFYVGNGSVGGFNIRHITAEHTALEGSLLFYTGGIGLEGLYQYQAPIEGVEGLHYFVGGGGFLGFGTGKGSETAFAFRLTGGLNYKITEVPIEVGLGFDPFFQITPGTSADLRLGIAFRYILK